MKKVILPIMILIFLAQYSCTKADTTYNINPTLKDYFSWQRYTYWIYADSVTGKTDSMYLYGAPDYSPGISSTGYEYIFLALGIDSNIGYDMYVTRDYSYIQESDTSFVINDTITKSVPFDDPKYTSPNYTCSLLAIININGIGYKNVYKISTNGNSYYINYSKGIIKFTIQSNHNYNLLRTNFSRVK